ECSHGIAAARHTPRVSPVAASLGGPPCVLLHSAAMERFSPGTRAPIGLPIVLLAVLAACSSGGGGGGCTAYEALPPGEFQGAKTDNAVNLRLSSSGLDYLNNNWHSL